ncbi:hypothetical protein OEJ37_09615 [Burkholderia sp. BKH01]|uniref:hypothetical protein n=1 Tax=Burkholderia sp. BKH01 TaxID=2769262 RepID=UPI0021E038D2|nr:hypothetical protein [Burkholderia sp. BKH01]MCU9953614.1 hypothetical protein [Burkholderia sp. BKH01]
MVNRAKRLRLYGINYSEAGYSGTAIAVLETGDSSASKYASASDVFVAKPVSGAHTADTCRLVVKASAPLNPSVPTVALSGAHHDPPHCQISQT